MASLGGILGLVLAAGAANTHVGHARVLHDGGDVCKVQIDEAGILDQIGDRLHRLAEHVVGDLESIGKGDLLIGGVLQPLVGDDDQRVHLILQLGNAALRLLHPAAALKAKGLVTTATVRISISLAISATMGAPPVPVPLSSERPHCRRLPHFPERPLTPWDKIENRLDCAAAGDFVICLYNPASKKRSDYLEKACDIILRHQSAHTPAGIVRNIGRDGQAVKILTLGELRSQHLDMFCTVFIATARQKS